MSSPGYVGKKKRCLDLAREKLCNFTYNLFAFELYSWLSTTSLPRLFIFVFYFVCNLPSLPTSLLPVNPSLCSVLVSSSIWEWVLALWLSLSLSLTHSLHYPLNKSEFFFTCLLCLFISFQDSYSLSPYHVLKVKMNSLVNVVGMTYKGPRCKRKMEWHSTSKLLVIDSLLWSSEFSFHSGIFVDMYMTLCLKVNKWQV